MKLKGYILAIISAATYGTNPVLAVPLYQTGLDTNTVLLFRYILALPILALMLKLRGHSLSLRRDEVLPMLMAGVSLGISSVALFESYRFMNVGIASTLLFVYPIMVAVAMIIFYGEKFRVVTAMSLLLMTVGMCLLMLNGTHFALSGLGCLLVMLSSASYAVYLVFVNVSKTASRVPTLKLTFYGLLFGSIVFIINMVRSPLIIPSQPFQWGCLLGLALLPTIVSFACATAAIPIIGSTSTAILGALEPVTAVVLSSIILNQHLTPREIAGGAMILFATTLVLSGDSTSKLLLRARRLFPRAGSKNVPTK